MSHWWRAHDEAVDDPKLQLLSDALLRAWFNVMCLSSANGGIVPPLAHVAFKLRMTPPKAAKTLEALTAAGLLDKVGDNLQPHNWNARQFKSDVSTERVQQFRERQRNVSPPIPRNVSGTPPDTERTDSDSERKKTDIGAVASATRPVGGEAFDEFWKAYPKREGANPKAPARKSFFSAVKSGVDPPAIIAAAKTYAADPSTKIGTSYVAQAVTWLNQKRWEDHVSGNIAIASDELERHRRECLTRADQAKQPEIRRDTGLGQNGAYHPDELRSADGMVRGESENVGQRMAVSVARSGCEIDSE